MFDTILLIGSVISFGLAAANINYGSVHSGWTGAALFALAALI